ncbi:MAG: sigma-54-dependent Fis family transcriptional regulator [Calditrichales bacterium]|nr:MAG: sigma-54-dependent Fis family transcriptional regulator [Calditrichales bacterium]
MNKIPRILIIDDEPEMLNGCSKILKALGYQPFPIQDGKVALNILEEENFDLILCDLLMPEIDGITILQTVQSTSPHTPVIIFTAYGTIDRAVTVMKHGAFDFIEKPFETEHLKILIDRGVNHKQLLDERENLLLQLKDKYSFDNIIGKSLVMRNVFEMIESVADSDSNVLITGESGTGKELIARSIHSRSMRCTNPFVPVNCGAFPENLFESELFGYEKGAFTGAMKKKIGLLEYADGGSFFLDEVCELPANLQTKLLRVLQDQQLRHIGGNDLIRVNIRLISATNRIIQNALAEGSLRNDFYYRLNVINIHLPPVRERREDIRLLSEYFLQETLKSSSKNISGFSDEVIDRFEKYNWPGNVREIQNIVERAVILARSEKITLSELPPEFQDKQELKYTFSDTSLSSAKKKAIAEIEKKYLVFQLQKYRGNITKMAAETGMTRRNIHHMLKNHNIDANAWR